MSRRVGPSGFSRPRLGFQCFHYHHSTLTLNQLLNRPETEEHEVKIRLLRVECTCTVHVHVKSLGEESFFPAIVFTEPHRHTVYVFVFYSTSTSDIETRLDCSPH
jgi:hypothetical protein